MSAQNPLTASAKAQFDMIKANVLKTANKVGPELYSFKPTPEVRSMGEILGHVADANFGICAAAAGEKPTQGGFEKKTAKADIVKGLTDSIAYCDKVIASLSDSTGAAAVPFSATRCRSCRSLLQHQPQQRAPATWSPSG
jgi:hypothetical protein